MFPEQVNDDGLSALFDSTVIDLCKLLLKQPERSLDDRVNEDPRLAAIVPMLVDAIKGKYVIEDAEQYFVNGGRFEVAWDDINLADSTVNIVSTGSYEFDSGNTYTSKLESVIDLDLLSSHNQQILSGYYNNHINKPQPKLIDTQ